MADATFAELGVPAALVEVLATQRITEPFEVQALTIPDALAGRDILVNSVAPGFIETDMSDEVPEEIRNAIIARVPQQRLGQPDEVADVVAFLATRASYVNGSVVHVNGGLFGG